MRQVSAAGGKHKLNRETGEMQVNHTALQPRNKSIATHTQIVPNLPKSDISKWQSAKANELQQTNIFVKVSQLAKARQVQHNLVNHIYTVSHHARGIL